MKRNRTENTPLSFLFVLSCFIVRFLRFQFQLTAHSIGTASCCFSSQKHQIKIKNKDFRRWIQRIYVEQTCIVVGSKHLLTVIIVDELATNPIGLGSGNFHIDESFAMKFIGFVASYFMFLADSKQKSFSNSQ
ncbi:unnamed protein product [Orchesella dallaii]|uniref:Uncharacterized protein n=1 Tax=Orchesella dallaii TaxID=48710 RepID=A0ABP1R0K1_9HEXA